jgi:hypothetical protein
MACTSQGYQFAYFAVQGCNMTKKQILDTIKLLSALEAWSFAEKHRLPDYLLENLDEIVEVLSAEVLNDKPV